MEVDRYLVRRFLGYPVDTEVIYDAGPTYLLCIEIPVGSIIINEEAIYSTTKVADLWIYGEDFQVF